MSAGLSPQMLAGCWQMLPPRREGGNISYEVRNKMVTIRLEIELLVLAGLYLLHCKSPGDYLKPKRSTNTHKSLQKAFRTVPRPRVTILFLTECGSVLVTLNKTRV